MTCNNGPALNPGRSDYMGCALTSPTRILRSDSPQSGSGWRKKNMICSTSPLTQEQLSTDNNKNVDLYQDQEWCCEFDTGVVASVILLSLHLSCEGYCSVRIVYLELFILVYFGPKAILTKSATNFNLRQKNHWHEMKSCHYQHIETLTLTARK